MLDLRRRIGLIQPNWRPEARVLLAVAVAITVIFALTPLDAAAERIFYRAEGSDHWPFARLWPFSFLYQLAPFITGSLLIIGLGVLLIGHLRRQEALRKTGIFLVGCVVIGPGLIINAALKDHWGRPRPRDVVEFGGTLHYTPAPWRGEGGSSFPCGHCSVGFLYASGWWLWKRRRPRWAAASLATGLTVGGALGLGRMAAGGHFLSDVIWSALLALGLAHVLYYHILRLASEDAPDWWAGSRQPLRLPGTLAITMLATVGAAMALTALFVTPHGRQLRAQVDISSLPNAPRVFEVTARTANIDLVIGDFKESKIIVDGELHGFGPPGSRLDASTEFRATPIPTIIYRIDEQGWITDLSAAATIRVPVGALQRIVVALQQGDIKVTDTTRSRVVQSGALKLELHTESGHVQLHSSF